MEGDGELMSLADAAKPLGITPDALRVAVHRGKLQDIKIGNSWATTKKWLIEAGYEIQ